MAFKRKDFPLLIICIIGSYRQQPIERQRIVTIHAIHLQQDSTDRPTDRPTDRQGDGVTGGVVWGGGGSARLHAVNRTYIKLIKIKNKNKNKKTSSIHLVPYHPLSLDVALYRVFIPN